MAALHRARWEHITLDIGAHHLPTIIGPMPLLRYLDLYLEDHTFDPMDTATMHELPLLRTAILDIVAASLVILPWAQLTSLVLTRVDKNTCVSVLKQTPNLVHCQLDIYFVDDNNDDDERLDVLNIDLSCLKSLIIKDIGRDIVIGFLDIFVVPALLSLTIYEWILGSKPIGSLKSFISKSRCKLNNVHIMGPRSVSERSYHRAFPWVHKFSFSGPYDKDSEMSDEDLESESDSSSSEG
jgi:hypothetical protein